MVIRQLLLRAAERTMRRREPDFVIGGYENPITMRWWWGIPRNRWFNIYLHLWLKSDQDEVLHDHRGDTISWILENGFDEEFRERYARRYAGDVVFRRANKPHRVHMWPGCIAVSVFVTLTEYQDWGFYCPQGKVHWQRVVKPDGRHLSCGELNNDPIDRTLVLSAPTVAGRPGWRAGASDKTGPAGEPAGGQTTRAPQ